MPTMANRAYSALDIKGVNAETRSFRGIATTPAVDRAGDIVEPLGVRFKNPLPLLWQHDARKPIGTVRFDKPTKDGIGFTAELPNVEEPGALRDRIEEAWQSIQHGLVRAVSIGFRPIEYAFMDTGGIRFQQIEVFELSAVTIPAQAEAVIFPGKALDQAAVMAIKSFDTGAPAATGHSGRPVKVNRTPGAPGSDATLKPTKGAQDMPKTIAEQIGAFEATRQAKAARMDAIMAEAAEKGETLDAEKEQEYDTLADEVGKIDKHLERLRAQEARDAQKAKPVAGVKSAAEGSAARGGVVVKSHEASLAPGIRFARIAKATAMAHLTHRPPEQIAAQLYGADSEAVAVLKANEVVAGSNISGNWAADLTGAEGSAFADFAAFLRPATILGKFGMGGVPALRTVPFREPLVSQTGGGAGYWVGEGKPKPLTAFDFDRTTLEPLKCANIAVLTEENIRSSNPNSEMIVRDALRDALMARMDTDFVDPTNAGSAGAKPASITNGAAVVASTGTDADAIRLDVRALFQKFIDADNPPETGVWIMSTTNALALSMMVNALGQREFPSVSMTGGTFEGMPVIASRYASTYVALVNASDIYLGDEGGVSVDMSREASLEMKSATLAQDGTAGTGASLVSLWQSNLVGLRAERTINWKRRRTSAVAYLSGVAWGGAVPAS